MNSTFITQHFEGVAADITRLGYSLNELRESLEEQIQLLQMRELNLMPLELLQEATYLSASLDQLAKELEAENNELAQLRALAQTAAMINSTLDLNEVLGRAMDTVIALTDAERGYILLRNEETNEMEFVVGRKIGREDIEDSQMIISRSIVEEVIKSGEPIVTTNAQEDKRFNVHESIMSYALRSILCVPLIYRDEVRGVVYADNRLRPAIFGDSELKLLMSFANQASIAIQNARLYERVRLQLAEVTKNQQLLDSIFASITSGVITTDPNGIVSTFSPVAGAILNLQSEHTIGRPLTSVLPFLYEGFEQVLTDIQQQDRPENLEVVTVIPSRGPATLNLQFSPLKSEGEILGVALVLDDMTEIRQRDETLNVIRTYLSDEMVSNIQSIESLGLSGEEREITVINADVRGFTTFSENLSPEEVLAVINQYLTISSNAIQMYGGIIDKYMGDAVVGMYNTQLNPLDDHPERAVKAALTLIEEMHKLHQVLPAEQCLSYGIGIHKGLAVLGNVGSPSRKEFTALGDAIIFSKKLQEIAQPGELLISESVYEIVGSKFRTEPTERQLRGSNQIVLVYRVLGAIE
ncbi:MAG: hypothetical protein CUN55_07510 [Phototrophicales bacterium]|nr:MAG: hypothetical protein CUN55_07510 [Phototrophicales bacterium]